MILSKKRSQCGTTVVTKCDECGEIFEMARTARKGEKHFCDWKCYTNYRRRTNGFRHLNKNGRIKNQRGYVKVMVLKHPYRDSQGYVLEHRLVMEKHIKRYLRPKEVVHHKNKIVDDNRIENLKLFTSVGKHASYHFMLKRKEREVCCELS